MVGERGFEPPTPWSRTRCSTRLSHSPNLCLEGRSRPKGSWLVPSKRPANYLKVYQKGGAARDARQMLFPLTLRRRAFLAQRK